MPSRFASALGVFSLLAQTTLAQQPAPPAKKDTAYVLPGISVEAGRHAASPLVVPLALTRLTTRDLRGVRGYGLDAALAKVPGVLAQSRYGTSDIRLVIRGFGARGAGDRSNAGTTRGVRILLDGFPETEPDGRTSFDGIDLASASAIEVIRSNASALFGNASGGLVSISTLGDFDRRFAEAEFEGGTFGLRRLIARGGTLWSDSRLSGTFVRTTFDGWRQHSDAERTLGNVAVSAQLDPVTRLAVYGMASSNLFHIPGPLTQAEVDADPSLANATYQSRDERRFNRVGRLGATLEHELGGKAGSVSGSAYVNPKFLQRSERGTFRDFTRYHVGANAAYSNRGSLGGNAQGRFQVGLDEAYQDGAILFYSLTPEGTRGTDLRDNKREGANNLGVFAQAEVDFADRWGLSLGARYDRVTYYSQSFIDPALDASKAFSRLTPKAGLNFRLTPTHSLYANLGGGIEVPAGNETDPVSTFGQPDPITSINPLLDAIRSTTLEVGTKQVMLPTAGWVSDVSYDLALYHTRVTNDIVPYRGGRFYFTAATTRRTGAELGLTARSKSGWSLGTALTYSRNTYTKYVVDSTHYGQASGVADYSGNRMIGVPDFMYNVTLGFAPQRLRGLRLEVGAQGESKYFIDDANAVTVPGYTLFRATASLDDPIRLGGGLGVQGYVTVNNLFDRRHVGSAFLNPDVVSGVPVAFEPGLPRAVLIGVSLGWR